MKLKCYIKKENIFFYVNISEKNFIGLSVDLKF